MADGEVDGAAAVVGGLMALAVNLDAVFTAIGDGVVGILRGNGLGKGNGEAGEKRGDADLGDEGH